MNTIEKAKNEVTYDKDREMMYIDEYLRVNHQEVPQ